MTYRQETGRSALSDHIRINEAQGRFEVNQRAFFDDETLRRERDILFTKCWLFMGHESEIKQPGDYITRRVGGQDLIFIRDRDGDVRAFHNYCTHRGPLLTVQPSGNAKTLTCAYHGWVFDTSNGALKGQGAAYGYQDDFNTHGDHNLKQVPRIEHYRGFYFINFNPKAVDLRTYLAGSVDMLDLIVDQSDQGIEVIKGEQDLINGGNWKVITDNFIDMYHGPSLHTSYFDYAAIRTGNAAVGGTFLGYSQGFGNGHAYNENGFKLGRPNAVWIPAFGEESKPLIEAKYDQLEAKWGIERAERMAARNRNMVIFPNMVITDNVSISIRTVYPDQTDSFQMSIWTLGCVGEPPEIRDVRLRNHLQFVGPGGFAHPDDFELFDRMRQAYHTTPHKWLDYSKGMHTNVIKNGDRRTVRGELLDEAQQRAWWTQWDRMMAGAETLE